MANVEHELRGRLTKEQAAELRSHLEANAKTVKHNDKETHFFVVPRGLVLKLAKLSDGKSFISFKVGDETIGGLEEYEIDIASDDLPKAINLFKALGYKYNYVPQKRTDYLLDDEIELALKDTPDWGDHFEIEYVGDMNGKSSADVLQLLEDACRKLGITPMTPGEIEAFIEQINQHL